MKEGQSASFAVQAVSEHGLGTLGYSWEVKQPQAARTLAENDGWGAVGLQSTYTLASTALGQSGTQYRCKVTLTYIEVAEGGTETKKTIEAYSDAATLTVTGGPASRPRRRRGPSRAEAEPENSRGRLAGLLAGRARASGAVTPVPCPKGCVHVPT